MSHLNAQVYTMTQILTFGHFMGLQLYQIHMIQMVNTMLCKTLTLQLMNTYSAITNGEQYYTHPADVDVTECIVSKAYYCFISGGLCPVQDIWIVP